MDVKTLISSRCSEPTFFVNFYKIARPSVTRTDDFTYNIHKTSNINIWRILDEKLFKLSTDRLGIFFDSESYIIQWLFDLKVDNTIIDELLVYYWKGQHAKKGFSPLPPEIEEHCPVERIVQWSEPAIFFHSFPRNFITFSGQEDSFDINIPHLMLVRGELLEDIHLYEIPCEKQNLRSRGSFLLIVPNEKLFLYWHGNSTLPEHRENLLKTVQPHNTLKKWQKAWTHFSVQVLDEHSETTIFLKTVKGDVLDYCKIELTEAFSPKMFYLNSITGSFSATEVEYPLRAEDVIAPFPFLQSHLYTAAQPGDKQYSGFHNNWY